MADEVQDVLVAGAGPVGLTAAVELARRGVAVRVIDTLEQPRHYAKAVGLQPRTLEHWERTGMLTAALDEVQTMRGQIVHVDGAEVARLELAPAPGRALRLHVPAPVHDRAPARRGAAPPRRHRRARGRARRLLPGRRRGDGADPHLRRRGDRAGVLPRRGRRRPQRGAQGSRARLRGRRVRRGVHARRRRARLVAAARASASGSRAPSPDGPDDVLVAIPLPEHGRYRISMLAPPELSTRRRPDRTPVDDVVHGLESGHAPELHHLQAVVDRLAPEPTTVVRPALVVGVPHQPPARRPLRRRARVRRGRRRAHPPAHRRAGHEHRHPGRPATSPGSSRSSSTASRSPRCWRATTPSGARSARRSSGARCARRGRASTPTTRRR